MNYTIIENPYENESTVITTRGVMTDAKVAKLNNDKKKPALILGILITLLSVFGVIIVYLFRIEFFKISAFCMALMHTRRNRLFR